VRRVKLSTRMLRNKKSVKLLIGRHLLDAALPEFFGQQDWAGAGRESVLEV